MIDKQYYANLKYDLTWAELANRVNEDHGTDYDAVTVRELLRRTWERVQRERRDDIRFPILFFTDPHLPYALDGWLEFIQANYRKYRCNSIICGGDLFDNHAISYHEKDPDLHSPRSEMNLAYNEAQRLFEAFPYLKLLFGNHDRLIARKIKTAGLPERVMKKYEHIWDIPDTVELGMEFEYNGILFRHGEGSGGKDGAINTAIQEMRSFAQGHTHTYGGVKQHKTSGGWVMGINGGSLCDEHSRAMAYGKLFVKRPTQGCVIIYSDKQAMFVPFDK